MANSARSLPRAARRTWAMLPALAGLTLLTACPPSPEIDQSSAAAATNPNARVLCPRGTIPTEGHTMGALTSVWCERPDGTKHGPFVEWWENQQKRGAGSYRDGQRDGVWTFFLKSGQKDCEIEYRGGAVVSQHNATPPP